MANKYTTEKSRSIIDTETYKNDSFEIGNYAMDFVMDNILLVKLMDTNETGDVIKRNGLVLPAAHIQFAWRTGVVILAGPDCKHIKEGDIICYPNDKGIPVNGLEVRSKTFNGKLGIGTFLSEDRIFGRLITKSK